MAKTEKEMKLKQLAEWILENRKKHNMSLAKLAELIGCVPSAIFSWERGEKAPSFFYYQKMQKIFEEENNSDV